MRKKQAMSISRKHRQGWLVSVLVAAVVVCVWLVPTGSSLAASGSSDFSVTVTVQESLAVDMGGSILQMIGNDDMHVELVSRTGSSGGLSGSSGSQVIVTVSVL